MEAPTKLYVNTNDHLTRNGFYAFTENNRKDSIEYTRTDAFIEKAKKWFEEQNEWFDIDGVRHCDLEDFEDFKNYMKKEKV